MLRLLPTFLLLFSLRAVAGPVGTVMGGEADTNGWISKFLLEGLGTNSDFRSFFQQTQVITPGGGTNIVYTPNAADTNGLKILLTAPGFAPDGTLTTRTRTILGTEILRRPFPNDGSNDINAVDGTNAFFRVTLSDWIATNDTALLAYVTAGAFATTNAVTNCLAVSALPLTNNSSQQYPPPIINWTFPGWNQERGPFMRLRAVGFHHFAMNGQPLACVEFIVKDEAGTTTTNRVTGMTISATNDALPFAEYIADVSLAPFAHSNLLRCDFVAKPWIGTNTFDTRLDRYFHPTPFPASITNFYFTNTYSAIAVVSSASTGATPQATNTTYDLVQPGHYFNNPNAALAAIRGTNLSLFGHQDCGGAMVYVLDTTNAMGGTASMAGTPKVWATILAYPGSTVRFTNHTGSQDISDRVKIEGIELAFTGSMTPYVNIDHLWMKDCIWNTTATASLQLGLPSVYATGGRADTFTQGFKAFGANLVSFSLLRGIDLNTMNAPVHWRTMIGCKKLVHSGALFALVNGAAAFPGPPHDWQILYNNIFRAMSNATPFEVGGIWGITNGQAIVQNVFESVQSSSRFVFGIDSVATNVIDHHNTYEGARMQMWYNETGSSPVWRVWITQRNSIFTNTGEASDTDPPEDGGRIGDWSVRYRVGSPGNFIQMLHYEGNHSDLEFKGLYTFRPDGTNRSNAAFIRYVDRRGTGSGASPLGSGYYRLLPGSPALNLRNSDVLLPYDIEGNPRYASGAPGAYEFYNNKIVIRGGQRIVIQGGQRVQMQ